MKRNGNSLDGLEEREAPTAHIESKQLLLLHDAACAHCREIAARAVTSAGGLLEARRLHEPEIRDLLNRVRPG